MKNSNRICLNLLTLKEIEELFARFKKNNPLPKGELNFSSPFTLLVAVVLSAQATDKSVNNVTEKLFNIADTPEKMINLGEYKIMETIKKIGLFRTKSKNVYNLSRQLVCRFDSLVPNNLNDLMSLPGVGRKTANVVLNLAFGHKTLAVDTHVFRVSLRSGLARGANVIDVEESLVSRVPKKFMKHAHHWLILHGRYVCKSRKPLCIDCIINDICLYKKNSSK